MTLNTAFDASNPTRSTPKQSGLSSYSVQDLLILRAQIDELLPVKSLRDMNLEQELVIQYQAAKVMQESLDETTPANQRAQVASTVASILGQLNKVQEAKYNAERLKNLERHLVETLEKFPAALTQQFFDTYQARYM